MRRHIRPRSPNTSHSRAPMNTTGPVDLAPSVAALVAAVLVLTAADVSAGATAGRRSGHDGQDGLDDEASDLDVTSEGGAVTGDSCGTARCHRTSSRSLTTRTPMRSSTACRPSRSFRETQGLGQFGTISRVSETREPLRRTFDLAADVYDTARPSYPAELFDDLVGLAELKPGARLLEIGCGTGKATRPLLERGFHVVCVEIGARLAERARRNLAGFPLEIDVMPSEATSSTQQPPGIG
jgi:hypothetical protein